MSDLERLEEARLYLESWEKCSAKELGPQPTEFVHKMLRDLYDIAVSAQPSAEGTAIGCCPKCLATLYQHHNGCPYCWAVFIAPAPSPDGCKFHTSPDPPAGAPVDSRKSGPDVDSRIAAEIELNSRKL